MSKLGTGASVQKKQQDVEKELSDIISMNIPKEEAFSRFSRILMNDAIGVLDQGIKEFRPSFCGSYLPTGTNITSPLLPEGTRFYKKDGAIEYLVIEQKPSIRTLDFGSETYRISLPYCVWIIVYYELVLNRVMLGARNTTLSDMAESMNFMPLPNVGFSGSFYSLSDNYGVCLGKRFNYDRLTGQSIAEQSNIIMNHFWNSSFNTDASDNFYKFIGANYGGDLNVWEKASLENPLAFSKAKYVNPGKSIYDVIENAKIHAGSGSRQAEASVVKYVMELHDKVWSQLLDKARENQVVVARLFVKVLDQILRKFASELATGMASFNNETIRRTVQISITKALAGCIK